MFGVFGIASDFCHHNIIALYSEPLASVHVLIVT